MAVMRSASRRSVKICPRPFLAGSLRHLPVAEATFGRYHVRSHLSKAMDEIRREEAKQHKQLLNNTRYVWLWRPTNLTVRQQDLLDS